MPVQCSKCGEELLGAVNRCWKCGTEFASRPRPIDLPPVRRGPVTAGDDAVPAEAVAEATISEPDVSRGDQGTPDGVFAAQVVDGEADAEPEPESQTRAQQYDRIGSPFAEAGDPARSPDFTARGPRPDPGAPAQQIPIYSPPLDVPAYPQNAAATGGAIASLVVGILSLIGVLLLATGAIFSAVGTLLTSLLGMGLGVWGIYSKRRGIAIAGLLLSCITLSVSGFFGAVDLYEAIYGEDPFAPSVVEEGFDDEFIDEGEF